MLPATVLAAAVAGAAWRRRLLTGDGALAAAAAGGLVCAGGGWGWGSAMIAFFLSSSALSRLQQRSKDELAAFWEKGDRRDAGQVLANGGLPMLAALWQGLFPGAVPSAAYFGALAASTADTWATEVGVLQDAPPRLITTWRPVPRGTSGGVTAVGSLASIAGALFIAGIAGVVADRGELLCPSAEGRGCWRLFGATLAGGIAGSVTDSLLGAKVQAAYRCASCQCSTEQPVHRCGAVTELQRGYSWITNDAVNLLAAAAGATVAALWAGGAWEPHHRSSPDLTSPTVARRGGTATDR